MLNDVHITHNTLYAVVYFYADNDRLIIIILPNKVKPYRSIPILCFNVYIVV